MTRPRLRELADRLGIIPEYLDQTGRSIRRTSDATRESLLAIMGFDAPTEDAAAGWLSELDHETRGAIVDPVRVVERESAEARRVHIRVPAGFGETEAEVTLTEEAGHVWTVRKKARGRTTLTLPTRVPFGYHTLAVTLRGRRGERVAAQSLIVVPSACVGPRRLLRGDGARRRATPRAMGIVANLYSVRREHDWGIGDFTTLARLVEWAGGRGAQFVGVNPLHALVNRGMDTSPYSPASRLFRNTAYIDVEQVPELVHSETARALLNAPDVRAALRRLRASPLVDYDGVIDLKDRILTELHRTFRAERASEERHRRYADFVRARDPDLTRFATWMAIAEASRMPDWRQWPDAMHDPSSAAVDAFRAANAERVDYHRWLQFEAHTQLAVVAERARVAGMRVGVYQDLAIGTSGGGSDTWSNPELFLVGASIGAPPDPYAADGQNWGLPPMDPRALRRQGYRFWIQLLRGAFEHAGALRIDHVMGLFRSFWIPDGASGKQGAYVRFPSRDLLGILALESERHDALVVGEDLGTVPKEVPPALKKWGVLSSKVLYFERDQKGFKPAGRYPAQSLATANTHDMPTLAGFWSERDIELRAQVGLLKSPAQVAAARRQRAADKSALLATLGLAAPRAYEEAHFPRRLTGAVHKFLCSSHAALVGISLDDLIGEVDPVNLPGVGPDAYPSWRRRTRLTVEAINWSFEVDDAIRCDSRRAS